MLKDEREYQKSNCKNAYGIHKRRESISLNAYALHQRPIDTSTSRILCHFSRGVESGSGRKGDIQKRVTRKSTPSRDKCCPTAYRINWLEISLGFDELSEIN